MEHADLWLRMADVVGSMMILAGLWGSASNKKWWLVYCLGTVFFLYVTISKGLVGLTVMGLATFFTGLRNSRHKRATDD